MVRHWVNELMNLIAGNSRYVHYPVFWQFLFILLLFVLLLIPVLLHFLA
ncbi:hypothetical protein Slin_2887 [Spirosoma linguale DSM 74]|uniref:Uncharacterized protein n=1 Tax=Spirosoma linguale (strain ATCC 33905 / DSM 74 / LMG 10896 / Claus 1) TaxID=504472 RepID=D2QJI7_SPILD|nr:hypothetical protein Slin_2887 [Spirosoma linguale DSM 74]